MKRSGAAQAPPIHFTRLRADQKNDPAHIEQKNFTTGRPGFGSGRYAHPAVRPLVHELCRGALDQWLNHFLPTMKLEKKERVGSQTVREYGPTPTPRARVPACAAVSPQTRARLRAGRAGLTAFAVRREVARRLKETEAVRQGTAA